MRRIHRQAAVVLAAAIVIASCGGGGSGSVDQADTFPSAAVCRGDANENAPARSGNDQGYVYVNEGEGWKAQWFDTFGDKRAALPETEASVILCATVTQSSEVDRCEFETDGEAFSLILMEATYDVALRAASTAEVIATKTMTASNEECPFSTSWRTGEGERASFAPPADDIAAFLEASLNW